MTDTCPNCCRRAVDPAGSRSDSRQITDRYRCPRCGHTWITRRDADAYRDYDPADTGATPAA